METEICECCGAKMVKYWHTLNKPLCSALCKLYVENKPVNIADTFTHNQTCNFQKLKYYSFVRKSTESGKWEITERGKDFCEKKIKVQMRVQTYRGKVTDMTGTPVYIDEIMKETYDKIGEYVKTRVGKSGIQPSLFQELAI